MDRRRKLLNGYERATEREVDGAASRFGAKVRVKVRMADALDINRSGLTDAEYRYALQAHLDFLVTDSDTSVLFAVEFDGVAHDSDVSTILRDGLKNSICEKLELPLLRIDAAFLRRVDRFSLVGWLAELWFLYDGFRKAQDAGLIPPYEMFTFFGVLGAAYWEGGTLVELQPNSVEKVQRHANDMAITNPYDPFVSYRSQITRLYEQGVCLDPTPDELFAYAPDGYASAIAIVRLARDRGAIVGIGRCRPFHFPPVVPSELAAELAVQAAALKLRAYGRGTQEAVTLAYAREWRSRLIQWGAFT